MIESILITICSILNTLIGVTLIVFGCIFYLYALGKNLKYMGFRVKIINIRNGFLKKNQNKSYLFQKQLDFY